MKKLLLIAILFITIIGCSPEESPTTSANGCSTITYIGFTSSVGYYMYLQNGERINTGYIKPDYSIGDEYCINSI